MTALTTLMGRYRLLQPLDETRSIWRAVDELLQRDVMVQRIDDEALPAVRAATALKHPSAVTVHDLVTEDGAVWAVAEPVEGFGIQGEVTEEQAAELGVELLDALAAAHALGVVHGGVQPSSLVRTANGRVKLYGFGMSGPHALYTPPDPERTPASDLWGLSATLFTLLEGRAPFPSAEAIPYGQVMPPRRAPGLGGVLLPLLNPDPAARPCASQARRQLKSLLPERRGPGGPWRLHPLVPALVAVVLVVLIVPLTIALVRPDSPAGAGKSLTEPPDPCGLLTGEQVERLVVAPEEGRPTEPGMCTWSSDPALPSTVRFSLRVEVEISERPEETMEGERRISGWKGTTDALPGLGDEAFLKEESFQEPGAARTDGFTRMSVVFRMGDAVGTVELQRGGGSDDRVKAAAVQGARWVAEAMGRG